jgi:hypothetical protein
MANTVDTATDAGAENRTDEGARQKSAREMMMERIDERHEQALADQVQQQTLAPAATTEGEAVLVDDPKRFKLRVQIGEREEERPLDSVLQELQTSQGRLRSLSQRERELAAALAEKDRLLEEQLAAQRDLPATTDEEIESRVAEITKALIEGDEDAAKAALKEIVGKGRQSATPLDETQLVEKVEARLQQKQTQAQLDAVWEDFVTKYPEFREEVDQASGTVRVSEERQYGDYLYEREYKARVATGEISYQQALVDVAEKTRKVFTGQKESTEEPARKDTLSERQERKRQIDQLPVAAGARAAAAADDAGESHADVIKQMRQARGLPV